MKFGERPATLPHTVDFVFQGGSAAPDSIDLRQSAGDDDSESADDAEPTDEPPGHIRDNAFLVEEAFNQEPGVVQHIFNWINLWDHFPGGRTREFAWTYTMEIPLATQKHQFSFTTQMVDLFENPTGGAAEHQGGVGDTFLNYRYQLLDDDEFLWCAPRFSLILPTGDDRFGLGSGQLGYQWNLPISRYGERFDFHFNAGLTYIPNASAFLAIGGRSPRQDINAYNLGGSVFWKPQTYLHFFVEVLALWNEGFDDVGFLENTRELFINPGVRYAICQFEECEWVIGASAPIGATNDSPDVGVFAYMSVEHVFRKIPGQ
jgi:hypothetical protein